MATSSGRAKIGGVLNRLGGCVCITETSLIELGIPSRAIRDSEPSSHFFWVDARRLRRHMRKYNTHAQRQYRARLFAGEQESMRRQLIRERQQVLSGCAVRAAIQQESTGLFFQGAEVFWDPPGFSEVPWEWTHPERASGR